MLSYLLLTKPQILHGMCDDTTEVCPDRPYLEKAIERILKEARQASVAPLR